MKRILVTGGAGFIGQRTARALADRGYEVRILDLLEPPVHPEAQWPAGVLMFERIEGDVRSADTVLKALSGIDAVVHLAAYQDYLTDFSTFLATNATATALLYELILAHRLPIERIVIASSQAVYGEGRHACTEHGDQYPASRSLAQLQRGDWDVACAWCGETMNWRPTSEGRTNPQNPYGISKLAEELVGIHLGRRYGVPTVALRYSITQGAGQSPYNAYSGICRIFSTCALQGQPIPVYEDGRQMRDYVHVDDVVAANLLALVDSRMDYQALNVGGNDPISVADYAERVCRVAGVDGPVTVSRRFRVGDTRHIVSDSSRLLALGWRQTKGVTEIIQEYLAWSALQPVADDVVHLAQDRMRLAGAMGVAG